MSLKKHKLEEIASLPVLLRNPKILLIGGGKIALEKATVLKKNNINFFVVTKEISDEMIKLNIDYSLKGISIDDTKNFNIIIDATGSPEVNKLLEEEKKRRFFLLNTVDVPHKCDFYFSALLYYGKLKIAVSSDGASPTISQVVRSKIKKYLPKGLKELTEQKYNDRINGIIEPERTRNELNKIFGKVYLVGFGTGDPELLTLKAYRLIQEADVVLYDSLITKEILELIPEEVIKIYAGKPHGTKSLTQDEINIQLVEYARQGLSVVRLKSGDPLVFSRATEEVLYLVENQINFEIVPGVSSAIAGPASAGIPVTSRGYSANISIVSGCLSKNKLNLDWIELLKIKKHTTILLMGLKRINEIVEHALAAGVRGDLPAAIISNATRKNQKNIYTTLEKLPEFASTAETPALIVFGDVVDLSNLFNKQTIKPAAVDSPSVFFH